MGRAEKGKLKGKWHHISKSIFFFGLVASEERKISKIHAKGYFC